MDSKAKGAYTCQKQEVYRKKGTFISKLAIIKIKEKCQTLF